MLKEIQSLDRDLLVTLNSWHTDWLDPVMFWITKTEVWIPLYLFIVYLIFHYQGKQGWWAVAALILTVVITDQVTSSIMKPYFQRLRPSHEPSLEGVLHLVNDYRGGLYGFASSHAANTFGVATLTFLILRRYRKRTGLLFLWAAAMTYSRIYLGVHYPGDIVTGALIGIVSAWLIYLLYRRLTRDRISAPE